MVSLTMLYEAAQDLLSLSPTTYKVLVGILAIGGSLAGIVYLLRRFVAGAACHCKAQLPGKTVIITGGNSGIGKATAVDLARRNARVILACRSVEKGEKAAVDVRQRSGSSDVVFRQLDLSSLSSVRQFAAKILEEEARVDILINNAGLFGCPYWKTEDGFEMQFGVNHLGHFLLTNLLLQRMKEAPAARIVNVSSRLYKICEGIQFDDLNMERSYSPHRAYARSKLAAILFTRALARRLEGSGVTVNVLYPGIVGTDLGKHVWNKTSWPLRVLGISLWTLVTKTPRQGAQTVIHCAVSEELEGVTGKFFGECREQELVTHAATDDQAAERLWTVSAQMVGL